MDELLEKELKELMQSGFSSDTAAVSKMLCKTQLDEDEKDRLLDLIESLEVRES